MAITVNNAQNLWVARPRPGTPEFKAAKAELAELAKRSRETRYPLCEDYPHN